MFQSTSSTLLDTTGFSTAKALVDVGLGEAQISLSWNLKKYVYKRLNYLNPIDFSGNKSDVV